MGVETPNLPLSQTLSELLGNVLEGDVLKTVRIPIEALVDQLAITGFTPNAIGPFSGRSAYDEADLGFAYLSNDGDNDTDLAVVFVKLSDSDGDWSDPIPYQGPEGPGGYYIACSDEYTIINTLNSGATLRAVTPLTITKIRANLKTASVTGPVTIDIRINGVSIFTTLLSIDQGEKTSTTAAVPFVLNTNVIPDDAEITVVVVSPGAGAVGLKVIIGGNV